VNFHSVARQESAARSVTAVEVTLRPMRPDEFPAFEAESKRGYAHDMSENGGVDTDAARAKAECDLARLLPDGVASAGQFLFVIQDELGAARGTLWFADEERNGRRCAFLYDIRINEDSRGQGIGRLTMQQLEREVSARGLHSIELNVFGGNTVARSLYRTLGYTETFVGMSKELPAPPSEAGS
jgi:ribosomal protein S18 acetylase RimI-like enzyme